MKNDKNLSKKLDYLTTQRINYSFQELTAPISLRQQTSLSNKIKH